MNKVPTCHFITTKWGKADHCGAPSLVVIDYADGVGACFQHVRPVLLWAMEKQERGGLPDRKVEVVPAHQWLTYREYFKD